MLKRSKYKMSDIKVEWNARIPLVELLPSDDINMVTMWCAN